MTSLVKRVLRGGSGKKHNHGNRKEATANGNKDSRRQSEPVCPPSPDLTGLSPEEVTTLRDVIKRQELFEHEEVERLEKLRESVQIYEEEVKKHAGQKSKLKQVDLRLCRLCYKTKFADGIGKACADCHKRVCNKCGSFSKPKPNSKKTKGKWRCSMCQMKRDMVAMSGVWYHGNHGKPLAASTLMKKLSLSEMDSSENDHSTYKHSGTDVTVGDSMENRESDVFSSDVHTPLKKTTPTKKPTRLRRRSTSLSEQDSIDIEDDQYIDTQQFQLERQRCREQRQSKTSRRRLRSFGSQDSKIEVGTDSDLRQSETCSSQNEKLSCDQWNSSGTETSRSWSKRDRPGYRKTTDSSCLTSGESDSRDSRRSPKYRETRHDSLRERCNERRNQSDKIIKQKSNDETLRYSRDTEYDFRKYRQSSMKSNVSRHKSRSPSKESKGTVPSSVDKHSSPKKVRQDAQLKYYSNNKGENNYSSEKRSSKDSRASRDSFASRESRFSRESATSRDSFDQSPTRPRSKSKLTKSKIDKIQRQEECYYSSSSSLFSENKTSDYYEDERSDTSPCRPNQGSQGEQYFSPKPSIPKKKTLQGPILSANSLSPDMALDWDSRKNQRKSRSRDSTVYTHRSGSVSPKRSLGSTVHDMPSKDNHGRRMTLSQCQNIMFTEQMFGNNLVMSRPHEILIHKDKADQSVRTNGLGMRVVGGRMGPGGTLGAYVTSVIKGGPADAQNISEGDQIIEWNGRSLVDVTFEEAQDLLNKSGDIVQITVIHSLSSPSGNPSVRSRHPIILRAETVGTSESLKPPDFMILDKRKRRMLPKTPVEIKRDVRHIIGSLWMQLDFDSKCECLIVVLIRAEDIYAQRNEERQGPNAVAMLHLLPKRALHDSKESQMKTATNNPQWNETFVFPNISTDELACLALEVTVWNYQEMEDEFLGEVLLDLSEAQIDNTPTCYHLEDHDENSSPLPYRKKSFSFTDSTAVSPVTSQETSSLYPSRNPSPRSSVSTKATGSQRTLPITPAHDKARGLISLGKRSPVVTRLSPHMPQKLNMHGSKSDSSFGWIRQNGSRDFTSSNQSSPLHSPTSPRDEYDKHSSFSSLLRKKVSAVARLSSSLIMGGKKEDSFHDTYGRSKSYSDIRDSNLLGVSSPTHPRRSFESHSSVRFDMLTPPHHFSRSSSTKEFLKVSPEEPDLDHINGPIPDRLAPDGDDITSVLGAGQIAPKPSYETNVCGDIKMAFMVSKGQLEIDIIVVKGLMKSGMAAPPDTYVKTYLIHGAKTVQKKKTQTVRTSFDPIYRKTIKYSACNIHGRCIKVNVWEKQKTFDKKQCLGEALVKLDNLNLSQRTAGWYKLFPLGATEFCSSESLNYWGFG